MEYLRDGVHLRAMAQKDPLVEYRAEGHAMFEELGQMIREEVVRYLFHVEIEPGEAGQLAPAASGPNGGGNGQLVYEHESLAGADAIQAAGAGEGSGATGTGTTAGVVGAGATSVATGQRTVSEHQKVGRNDPCWCGSGKKFKKCHGA
jgi:preprotein translocase subunit SecA